MKTVVLGLGNTILSDDGAGVYAARMLRGIIDESVDVIEAELAGLDLMEMLKGYDRAIIIDAIVSDQVPGTVLELTPGSIPTQRSSSSHDVNLATALELGRRTGARLPDNDDIFIVAIEADDVYTFTEELSPDVEAAIPSAIQAVLNALDHERESS